MSTDRFIRVNDTTLKSSFIMLHKVLYTHPLYKEKLSVSAVLTYGILRDRISMSLDNGLVDGDGRVFVFCTIEELADILGVSERTAIKYYNQLSDVNLIERKKQGMGMSNKIFINEPEKIKLKEIMPEMRKRYEKFLKENSEGMEYEEYQKMLREEGILTGEENCTNEGAEDVEKAKVKKPASHNSSEVNQTASNKCRKLQTINTELNNTEIEHNTEWESATHPSKKKEEKSVLATRGKKKEKPKSKLADKSDFVSSQQNKAKKTLDEVVSDVKSTKRKKTPSMLFSHYVALFKQNFDRKAPVSTAKDKTLLKKLMNHYDYDTVMKMLDWMFEYWDYFKDTKNIDGAPTVGLFYGFESYIRDEVEKVRKQSSSSEVW